MMSRLIKLMCLAGPSLLLLEIGCSGAPASKMAPVHGKVSYQGRPLAMGTIVFTPDPLRGADGPLSLGEIQPDGSYTLRAGEAVGAVAGWHRVTVAAVETWAPINGSQFAPAPRSLLPAKYRDPELSGLSCEVKAGQDNGINFNLD